MQHLPMEATGQRLCICGGLNCKREIICRYTNYTTVWNALDYPALTFPVITVDPTLHAKEPPHSFYDDFDKEIYEMCE